jgi:glycosyltransferase involved in cell wall biosynthesis
MSRTAKKILLFSTLNPYPFWAGSENLWFDFVKDERVKSQLQFQVMLADSPVTREKGKALTASGISTGFYKHFNVDFARRNFFRLTDKLNRRKHRTLPWFDEIKKRPYDLVLFNVAALADLAELAYATELCSQKNIPYCLLLQHGYEDFFLSGNQELETVTGVVTGARRFIFISNRNRYALERAIGQKLVNAFHSVNAITAKKISDAGMLSREQGISNQGTAKFFNLGRFSPADKAQHLLLEAFAGEQWKDRDWQLSFIGVSGFGQSYLEKQIRFFGLSPERIKITGHTDNVLEEIVKHDVLLMPSLSEGTPFAMIESMACGRPAFGTPVGGIPELLAGNRGWLSATTSIRDITETMEAVCRDRDRWKEKGIASQDFIKENYSQEIAFPRLLQVIKECME